MALATETSRKGCAVLCGEFAYSILYAGILRKLAPLYKSLVVATRPDRMAFHTDYATRVIPHDFKCVGMNVTATPETRPTNAQLRAICPEGHDLIRVQDYGHNYIKAGEYIVYGQKVTEWTGAIVLHARERREYCDFRDWTRENWNRLGRLLAKEFPNNRRVCIGSMDGAHAVEGCFDARGIPLQDTMNMLHSANVFIGQSSGPAHLASHCGCPHIVWCEPGIDGLYQRHWNPHRTWVRTAVFPGDPHKPSYEMVREYVMGSLAELRREAA